MANTKQQNQSSEALVQNRRLLNQGSKNGYFGYGLTMG